MELRSVRISEPFQEARPGKNDFARRLIQWHEQGGRHDLPWQSTRDPYRVWLSEIMLQQTQVATVIPYYLRFLDRFPTLADLAAAPLENVMSLWSGLGYYARARNLHACAQAVLRRHGGAFPRDPEILAQLPGIGRSTAHAIAAFCFDARVAILDGNVKRVLARSFGIEGFPGTAAVEKRMWRLAEALLPTRGVATYLQAQMDLGATVCTRGKPVCQACPLQDVCIARRDGRTGELPAPRPTRTLPQRQVTLLVLIYQNDVLLEQRPPSGIWGGLLSLPELPPESAPEDYAARLGCKAGTWCELPPLTHGFTHFRLRVHPLLGVATPLPHAAQAGLRWLPLGGLGNSPLPAPIRKILEDVQARAGTESS